VTGAGDPSSDRSTPALPRWLASARRAAARPAPRARAGLHYGARGPAIGSIDPDLARRIAAAGLPLRPCVGGWDIEGDLDASLAAIAGWLLEQPLGLRRRHELLPVVDGDGRTLGGVERGVVRVLGLRSFAVHLSGRSARGGFWVQQRAFDKATDPGRWDTLMGGQVAAGETVETTLARETWEEAGLDVATLLELDRGESLTIRRPVAEGYMVEHIDVYTARLPAGAEPRNQDGEVERFECLTAAALDQRLAGDAFTLEATLILGARLRPVPKAS